MKLQLKTNLKKIFILTIAAVSIFHGLQGISQAGFVPLGKIYKAAKDDRNYRTQAEDTRLQLELKRTILLDQPTTVLSISGYVYLGHAFIVGEVANKSQRDELLKKAHGISGLRGISYFLPVKNDEKSKAPANLETKFKTLIEPNFPSANLTIKTVQNSIIVMGVLSSADQNKVLKKLEQISPEVELINFMISPDDTQAKRSRPHILKRIFN